MLHLLDTDTASYIIKRRSEKLAERLRQLDPGDVAISAVTRAELVYGLMRIDPAHRLHALVDQFSIPSRSCRGRLPQPTIMPTSAIS